jgi:hypothetical protein
LKDLVGARVRYLFRVQLLSGGLLEDLVVARVLYLFLVQLLSGGGRLEDLVGARVRYLFRVQLLSGGAGWLEDLVCARGRCLRCGIFFLFNYFPGGGRLDGLVDARVLYLFRVQLLSGGRCLKTWSLRGCGIFFLFNYFPGGGAA